MLALAQRNIKLYFRNHTGVVMSLIGALISFFFYICFLQKNLSFIKPMFYNDTKKRVRPLSPTLFLYIKPQFFDQPKCS